MKGFINSLIDKYKKSKQKSSKSTRIVIFDDTDCFIIISLSIIFFHLIYPQYYLSTEGGTLSIQHIRLGSQVYGDLMKVYSGLEFLPGSVLISDEAGQFRDPEGIQFRDVDGGQMKEGEGNIVRNFSSDLKTSEVLRYYDRELKSKGWVFYDIEIYKQLGRETPYKQVMYVKKGDQCEYWVYIAYNAEKVKMETKFSLFIILKRA